MHTNPLISLATFNHPAPGWNTRLQKAWDGQNRLHDEVIFLANGLPLILPAVYSPLAASETKSAVPASGLYDNIRVYMNRLENLIPSGGVNLAPLPDALNAGFYRQVTHNRDLLETTLMTTTLAADKSVLSIYRGVQLLNIALGGALWTNLPVEKFSLINHTQTLPNSRTTHTMTLTSQSHLVNILKFNKKIINIHYHQKVQEAAPKLLPTAPGPPIALLRPWNTGWLPSSSAYKWYLKEKLATPHLRALLTAFITAANA
ncbi:MAG: gamma-glutamyl-gamma-aminobutyrate hydrolase family protein [Candidatus Adiutrix intracellularis]|jgi:putative glutamine amidotransferase|nr:gamma-glutamyl-gamma-aminobutyrate hydrolase family protein [Candidatus Adiutrix intracellularis]